MAVLTSDELTAIRREVARGLQATGTPINFTKAQVNAAIQALEDWFEANRAAASTAINNATSPFVFTNAQKKQIMAYWLQLKFGKEK